MCQLSFECFIAIPVIYREGKGNMLVKRSYFLSCLVILECSSPEFPLLPLLIDTGRFPYEHKYELGPLILIGYGI